MWIEEACNKFGFNTEQAESLWAEWKCAIEDGDTSWGYMEWLKEKIAAAQNDLSYLADAAIHQLEGLGCTPENNSTLAMLIKVIDMVAPARAAERERIRKEAKS